jgi:hypothetical protein
MFHLGKRSRNLERMLDVRQGLTRSMAAEVLGWKD